MATLACDPFCRADPPAVYAALACPRDPGGCPRWRRWTGNSSPTAWCTATTRAPDGLKGDEGTFSLCTFWYVDALARSGRLADARLTLEKMHTYANHLGLYSEEIGSTGEQLGNFPQAFSHLSLISAAVNLDRELGTQR